MRITGENHLSRTKTTPTNNKLQSIQSAKLREFNNCKYCKFILIVNLKGKL